MFILGTSEGKEKKYLKKKMAKNFEKKCLTYSTLYDQISQRTPKRESTNRNINKKYACHIQSTDNQSQGKH